MVELNINRLCSYFAFEARDAPFALPHREAIPCSLAME